MFSYLCGCSAVACLCCFFFFSSRRRHTRLVSDWSSDVCSSDLSGPAALALAAGWLPHVAVLDLAMPGMDGYELGARLRALPGLARLRLVAQTVRSEERRVGKGGRARGARGRWRKRQEGETGRSS